MRGEGLWLFATQGGSGKIPTSLTPENLPFGELDHFDGLPLVRYIQQGFLGSVGQWETPRTDSTRTSFSCLVGAPTNVNKIKQIKACVVEIVLERRFAVLIAKVGVA